ncbi:hypothetical protein D1953_06905 [Peribacillus asahii]|uniref:Uncharacterized protein n=1 Tax=Peribacillus asahii TaxID=228899 RepID=A0A398BAA8_9BACI|nr:SIR2 family protein [Peribacillus asahii]RID87039.1 hypothetical protein D1953_06905 [Peribacillus asahii]
MSFEQLIKGSKLPVLFIGSGFSRRYLNSPDWEQLLIKIYEFIGKQKIDYVALKSRIKNKAENRKLGDGEVNSIIAEELEEEFNNYFYESDLVTEYSEWVEQEVNPFRMCIATIVGQLSILKEKEAEIEIFKSLKNKVMSVITTNYDTLIELLFSLTKESTFIGQPQLFNPNSLELGELYKIHGCITEPDNIIITKSDYDNFKENAKLFSAKLLTLISENPVVFIGYSINDPNMQQILTDLVRCLSHSQIESLKNHFYLIEFDSGNQELVEKQFLFKAKAYNGEETVFPISVISTDNYGEVYTKLSNLTPSMNINTVKQVKRIVKDIVIQSVESNQKTDDVMTIFMDDVSKLSETHQKFAIAVGNVKDINNAYGYNLRPIEDVLEDVLFDNKNLNSKRLIEETYELAYFKINRKLPIYKYSKDLSAKEINACPNVNHYLNSHNTKKHYLNNSIIKSLQNVQVSNDIKDMPPLEINYRRTYLWIIKNFENLPIEELRLILQKEFQGYSDFNSNRQSDYRRLVAIYDLYKFKA